MEHNKFNSLIFGTWLFDNYSKISHKEIVDLFSSAFDIGFKRFDTAESYGDGLAEMLLGRALKKNREQVEIYSKFSFHHSKKQEMKNALEKTLKRLNTDYLDIYFQHWPNLKVDNNKIIENLLELKEASYIKNIGVSNWELSDFENLEYLEFIDMVQICYNPLWRKAENELLSFLKEKKIKVMSYSPYAQGILIKKEFKPSDPARQKLIFSFDEMKKELDQLKIKLEKISKELEVSIITILLNWNLSKVNSTICSASNKNQLIEFKDNFKILESDKLDFIVEEIDNLTEIFIEKTKDYPNMWNWIRK